MKFQHTFKIECTECKEMNEIGMLYTDNQCFRLYCIECGHTMYIESENKEYKIVDINVFKKYYPYLKS